MMHIHLGTLGLLFMLQVVVDALRGDGGLPDGGGQQMRTNDVARGEMTGALRQLVIGIGIDQAASVIQLLQTLGKIAALADGRDDQIAFDIELGALNGLGPAVDHLALGHSQCGRATFGVDDHLDRHDAIQDLDAFTQGILDFVFGCGHFLALRTGRSG